MKIAYLILAHHQPRHLARLINALGCDDVYFFVHIDGKSQMSDFERLLTTRENVVVLKERVKVYRFDFSQIKATMKLLLAAVNFNANFHRYCLLSGVDFPIKSNDYIKRCLSTEKQFMRIDIRAGAQKMTLRYGSRPLPFKFFLAPLHYFLMIFPKREYKKLALYRGSQWWSLTHECVTYILNFLEKNNGYFRFQRFMAVPDETFFHSIVKASPYSQYILHDFERESSLEVYFKLNEHGSHYIDWNAKGVALPKVLDITDFNKLKDSKALFARKFKEEESAVLLDQLEAMRFGNS